MRGLTLVQTLELVCGLGVSYRTAWLLKHKFMQVMCKQWDGHPHP